MQTEMKKRNATTDHIWYTTVNTDCSLLNSPEKRANAWITK